MLSHPLETLNILVLDENPDNIKRIKSVIYKIFLQVNAIAVFTFKEAKETLEGRGRHSDHISGGTSEVRSKIHILLVGNIPLDRAKSGELFDLTDEGKEIRILGCRDGRNFLNFNQLIGKLLKIREELAKLWGPLEAEDTPIYIEEGEVTVIHHSFNEQMPNEKLIRDHILLGLIHSIASFKRGEKSIPINQDVLALYQAIINTLLYETGATLRRMPLELEVEGLMISRKGVGRRRLLILEDYLFELEIISERIYRQRTQVR